MNTRFGMGKTLALLTLLLFMSTAYAGGKNETAITIWLVIFNSPADCATDPCSEADLGNADALPEVCYLTGQSVQANRRVTVAGRLAEGPTHGCFFDTGLNDSDAAEIHSVLQQHGWSKMAGYGLGEQVAYFEGGCNPDCADTQFSIHRPADSDGGHSVSAVRRFADGSMVEGASSILMREGDGIAFVQHTRLDEEE
jgi:hypothetical protein